MKKFKVVFKELRDDLEVEAVFFSFIDEFVKFYKDADSVFTCMVNADSILYMSEIK